MYRVIHKSLRDFRNLRCTVTIDSVLANSKTQNAFLFTVNDIFLHDYPLAVEPGSTPRPIVQKKKTWRGSLLIDMFLSTVSVLVVAQSSSEIPEGLMNNPVHTLADHGSCAFLRRGSATARLLGLSVRNRQGHGILSLVIVVCCQVQEPASG